MRSGPICNCRRHSISRGQNRFWTQLAAYAVMSLHYAYSSDYHRSLGLLQSGQLMALGFPLEIKLKIVGLCFTESLGSDDLLRLLSISCNMPLNIQKMWFSTPTSCSHFALQILRVLACSIFFKTRPAVEHQVGYTDFSKTKPFSQGGTLLRHFQHMQVWVQHPVLFSTPEAEFCSHCFLLRDLAFHLLLQGRVPMHPCSSISDKLRLTLCLKKCISFFPCFVCSRGGQCVATPRTHI